MTETLFAFDERNYQECQNTFRGENNQEYYLGDYTIDAGSAIDVRADKKSVGSCSIIRLRSKSRLFFRRSLNHIREDATDVMVLWFVKRGGMNLSYQAARCTAQPGDFVITKSMSPFTIECTTDDNSVHEVLHVIVPTHVFRQFFPHEIKEGFTMPTSSRELAIAERMLADIFNDGDAELSPRVEQILLDSALSVITEALNDCDGSTKERVSLSEKRFQDVMRFVEIHLSDPKLNAAKVADACKISQRYLSHLLKQHDTSFSSLVWDWRLKNAHQWLSDTSPAEISIAEIAFRVGFKSPAHFSRLFKQVYKVGPREYRSSQRLPSVQANASEQKHEFYNAGSRLLQ
jgi:AraC-like DNA-binding protein